MANGCIYVLCMYVCVFLQITEGFGTCDPADEESSCAANEICRGGYYYIDPNGNRLPARGGYGLCTPNNTAVPELPADYVLCGHVEFMPPEEQARLAAEAAADAAAELIEQQEAAAEEARCLREYGPGGCP